VSLSGVSLWQATFNPLSSPGVPAVPLSVPTVAPECNEGDDGAHGIAGVDCTVCQQKAQAGTVFEGVVSGTVPIVPAARVFCFAHWLDVARAAQLQGAVR